MIDDESVLTFRPLASIFLCMFLAIASGAANAKAVKPEFRKIWSAPNTEINSPEFSRDGKHIAFCRKIHSPDGHEAESYSNDELNKRAQKSKKDSRWEDPEIVCLSLQDGRVERIDYGWSPIFGHDPQTIFFVHQVKPISGLRVLAATQKGNEICSFNRHTKKLKVLAKPDTGYLDHPLLSPDGRLLAYSICDAVNGEWGGPVGIGLINLSTGATSVPVKPTKHHKLFDLISTVTWSNDQLLAIRETPRSEGMYLSDSYDVELINATSALRPIYKSPNPGPMSEFKIERNADNTITVIDDKRRLLVDPNSGRGLGPARSAQALGLYNRDKSLCIRKSGKQFVIIDTKSEKTVASFPDPTPEFEGGGCAAPQFVWSTDNQLAMVVDKPKTKDQSQVFDRSELYVLDLRPEARTAKPAN